MEKQKKYTIRPTTKADIPGVTQLAQNSKGVLLDVSPQDIAEWSEKGHSLVVEHEGEIVGHQAVSQWPASGAYELRAAYVKPEHRGQGLNTEMKQKTMSHIESQDTDATFIGVAQPGSMSGGILKSLGFTEEPLSSAHEEIFTVCDKGNCFGHTGEVGPDGSPACGCKYYRRCAKKKGQ